MIEKIIVVAPTTAVPISTGFAVALNVLPAPSFSSRCSLAFSNLGIEAEVLLDVRIDARNLFDRRQFVNRLRIVRNRSIRVDRNRHRPHSEKSERNQTERKDRRRQSSCSRGKSVLT